MPSLQLYSDSSPNGFKITIALEELGLPYALHH
ncbi:glutathione S-transferase, partial [Pseudomonas aeruginosa]|nr:glutathione S-transferase [Pseudomonas aeruginosa]